MATKQQHQEAFSSSLTKSVTFSDQATMRLGLHINDYTKEELEASFYSAESISQHRRNVKRELLRIANCHAAMDEINDSARGLEYYTREAEKTRSNLHKTVWFVVEREQWKQTFRAVLVDRNTSGSDDSNLAALYGLYSQRCATTAYKAGLADELAAKDIWDLGNAEQPNNKPSTATRRSRQTRRKAVPRLIARLYYRRKVSNFILVSAKQ